MNRFLDTQYGSIVCGDSRIAMQELATESVDLIFTSPPYAILTQKSYGNPEQHEYVKWFCQFVPEFKRILKDSGSLVINTGGAWNPQHASRTLYQWRLLLELCDTYKFFLAQDFYWFIPGRLTTVEYASRQKIRVRDAVEQIWWLSKIEKPKADVTKVLFSYSESFKKFLREDMSTKMNYKSESHSGLNIYGKNLKDNGGRIPYNMLYVSASSGSQDSYFKRCEANNITPHPARFPKPIPMFFISMLTEVGDMVLDPFGGSCTTGAVAEEMKRKWMCIELLTENARGGMLRFKEILAPETETIKSSSSLF